MKTIEERERRLAVARLATGIELLLGAVALAIGAFVLLAWPPYFGLPGIVAIGELGIAFGFLWLLRVRFRGPEDGARSNWRSH